jgi:glyoxylase-like metal-dependent hydrolase (beta-lactamase superfamily II)
LNNNILIGEIEMIEVYENIYLEEISLPNNPLKYLNFYVIKGKEKSMIIDTGFNHKDIKEKIMQVFKKLNLVPKKTILFLTHLHSDHTGLASYFENLGLSIYISKVDGEILNSSKSISEPFWENLSKTEILQGLKEDNLDIKQHPGFKYRTKSKIKYIPAIPGKYIEIDKYKFKIIDLKGHTPGMVGLYEEEHKILFCGDHILGKITPNITYWGAKHGDMLGKYFESLDLVYNMDIEYLFSSHRFLIDDHKKRIKELYEHHRDRLDEVRNALQKLGRATVRTVAQNMHWDIKSKNWDDFPKPQKWFAVGEAHAHLEHLRALKEINVEEQNGVLYYTYIPK